MGVAFALVATAFLGPGCGRPLGAWFGSEGVDPPLEDPIWPNWGGGPGRTGQSPYRGPQRGDLVVIPLVPPVVEDEPAISHVIPGAIDRQGQVFVVARDADNSGWLFGIDAALEPFWAFRPSHGSVSGLPALTRDGTLMVEARDEQLHGPLSEWYQPLVLGVSPPWALGWTYRPSTDALCSQFFTASQPLVASDGTLLLAMRSDAVENQLRALGPDGSTRWQWSRTAGWRTNTALGPDGTLVVAVSEASNTRIFGLSPEGQTLWSTLASSYSYQGLGLLDALAVDAEGRIFAAGERRIYAFSSTGQELWSVLTPEATVTAGIGVAPDGTLYLGTQTAPTGEESVSGSFHAFSAETGEALWSRATGKVPCGIPVVDAEGTAYLVARGVETGQRSEILAITRSGQVKFRKAFQDELMPCGQGTSAWFVSSPMLDARGRLWVGTHTNRLLVVTR